MFLSCDSTSQELQKAILKECPSRSKSPSVWLDYLNKMETKVRNLNHVESSDQTLFNLYDGVCLWLPESWTEEAYLVVSIRKAVLAAQHNIDTSLNLLSICAMNARSNPRVIIAVAFYYDKAGKNPRARALLSSAQKHVDTTGQRLLAEAINILSVNGDLRPLMGPFYYEPPWTSANKNSPPLARIGSSFCPDNKVVQSAPLEHIAEKPEPTETTNHQFLVANNKATPATDLPGEDASASHTRGSKPLVPTIPEEVPAPASCEPEVQSVPEVTAAPLAPQKSGQCLYVNGNPYWVCGILGRGGSSVVYSVEDSQGNPFALKKVDLTDATKELALSYSNEITMLLTLRDTNCIIRLYDYQHTTTHLLLVLEKACMDFKVFLLQLARQSGQENAQDRIGPIPISDIVFCWKQMLQCVKTLHDRRIVHLDLKPSNFVVVNNKIKLIDLGISQRLPDDATSVSPAVQFGTLTFMSPEQLDGQSMLTSGASDRETVEEVRFKVGRKSDIWSLGVMLYVMVYNRPPFQQPTVQSRMIAIVNPNVTIEFPPVANKGISQALHRCLIRDYRQRASVEELLSIDYTG